jgi:IclR family mhp operon transcriptional activator
MGATGDNAFTPSRKRAPSAATLALTGEPSLERWLGKPSLRSRCRTNSRRGSTEPEQRSYPPVEAVCRALDVLRTVNKLGIASINSIHQATGFPKPTIVRMLETLSAEGYVTRDNLCGGYWVTSRVHELTSGYQGIPHIIEASRPAAVELTRRLKWPIGIGVIDGDAISIKFWTGAISPWAHTNTVLGLRPDFVSTAMGRAYLAFCPARECDEQLRRLRADAARNFGARDEKRLRAVLDRARADGYAVRDPKTRPYRTTTLAMPIREGENVHALISISFFTTAIAPQDIQEKIVEPLRATTRTIEQAFGAMNAASPPRESAPALELSF